MKKNICWTDSHILKIARKMHSTCPASMLGQIRRQVIDGEKTRIHGLFDHLEDAIAEVLPTKLQKFLPTLSQTDINRVKTALAYIRSSNSANVYVPVAARKTSASKTAAKSAKKAKAKLAKPSKAVANALSELNNINKSLAALGLSTANRSKILNNIVDAK